MRQHSIQRFSRYRTHPYIRRKDQARGKRNGPVKSTGDEDVGLVKKVGRVEVQRAPPRNPRLLARSEPPAPPPSALPLSRPRTMTTTTKRTLNLPPSAPDVSPPKARTSATHPRLVKEIKTFKRGEVNLNKVYISYSLKWYI